jgi:predicted TIM-barrel fold metal-dependent hydrolase
MDNFRGTAVTRSGITRRDLLTSLAAGGAAVLAVNKISAQGGNPRRIDVHHHYALPDSGNGKKGGGTVWTPALALEQMDKHGIETTLFSRPGGEGEEGGEKARAFVRRCNEYIAKVVSDNRKRFGFFAVIPYSDTDGAMKELEYAYDTLKADGVGLMSSIGDKWPGDPAFEEVFKELNRRKAILFQHPFTSACCRTLIPGGEGSVERDFDSTRAVTNLLYSGTLSRYPDIRYIINHSGADVPVEAGRIKDRVPGFSTYGGKPLANHDGRTEKTPNGVFYELKKLYFECAHAAYPAAMAALTAFAPSTQYLFGTDWPAEPMESTLDELPKNNLSPQVMQALNRGNAEKLFPRFKS